MDTCMQFTEKIHRYFITLFQLQSLLTTASEILTKLNVSVFDVDASALN